MQEPDRPAEQIEQIHAMMARSTTFLSLSGLSGLAAGLIGLGAAWQISRTIHTVWLTDELFVSLRDSPSMVRSLTGLFFWTLIAALTIAFLFTLRRAKRYHLGVWNMASRRFALHLALPLLAGGAFVAAISFQGTFELVCPAMLLFFGLALVSAGKYSFPETVIFGVVEMALGLAAAFWVEGGLILWACGFGLVLVGYGLVMYLKYDR
jgi:hypothetical protein